MPVFRFGSYLLTPTSYSLIGQLYTFKLVDQLRSLIMIRKLDLNVKHFNLSYSSPSACIFRKISYCFFKPFSILELPLALKYCTPIKLLGRYCWAIQSPG